MKPFSPCSALLPRPNFHHHYHQWNPRDRYELCRTLQGAQVVVKLSRKQAMVLQESPELEAQIYHKLAEEFQKEAGSENILKALDIRSDENQHWLVLEYAEKGDLFDHCKDGGLGLERAKSIFYQAAQGVLYLHRRGVVHRDISLENLLLTGAEVCKICDFGQARIVGTDHFTRSKAGKRGYMAPEIIANNDVNLLLADVFSLGVCLFVMLSGYPPFVEASPSDQRYRVVQRGDLAKLVRVWKLSPKFPASAIDLLNGMLCVQERRMSLQQVLDHVFFQKHIADAVKHVSD